MEFQNSFYFTPYQNYNYLPPNHHSHTEKSLSKKKKKLLIFLPWKKEMDFTKDWPREWRCLVWKTNVSFTLVKAQKSILEFNKIWRCRKKTVGCRKTPPSLLSEWKGPKRKTISPFGVSAVTARGSFSCDKARTPLHSLSRFKLYLLNQIPSQTPPFKRMLRNDDIRVVSSAIKIPLPSKRPTCPLRTAHSHIANATNSFAQLVNSFAFHSTEFTRSVLQKSSLFCSATLSLTGDRKRACPLRRLASLSLAEEAQQKARQNEERVLISEVLVRNKDGEEMERKDLEAEAVQALKACRPNSALTVREVQEDVHRIINSGYFSSCMPVAVDTRDGIRLVFQVCSVFSCWIMTITHWNWDYVLKWFCLDFHILVFYVKSEALFDCSDVSTAWRYPISISF